MHIATITTKNKKTGKVYINHKLIQTIRTEKGPRNRVVMSLGKLNLPKDDLKKLAFVLESRITGQVSLFEDDGYITKIADEAMAHFDFNTLRRKPSGKMSSTNF